MKVESPKVTEFPTGVQGSKALEPEEFSRVLGLTTWLMTISKEHRNLPLKALDERVLPAIMLKQFRLVMKDKMPAAFIGWAIVSDEIAAKFRKTGKAPLLAEWRSGSNLIIVECISPFAPIEKVKADFFATQNKLNQEGKQ